MQPKRQVPPVLTLVRLAWQADRLGLTVLIGASVASAAGALGAMVAVGSLLNGLAASGRLDPVASWTALAAIAAVFCLQRVAFPFLGPAVESLEHRLTLLVQQRVMAPVLAPSTIGHLEHPAVADELRLAAQVGSEGFSAQQTLGALNELAASRLVAVAAGVLLGTWRWWAPVVLAAAWLCTRAWYRAQMRTLVTSMERSTAELRAAEYVSELILGGKAAKEARIFGITPWLVGRYQDRWLTGMTGVWAQRRRGRLATAGAALVLFSAHAAVLALLVRSALAGELALGDLFMFFNAGLGLAGLGFQPENEYILKMGTAPLPHIAAVEHAVRRAATPAQHDETEPHTRRAARRARRHPAPPAPPPVPAAGAPRRGIRFESVSFAYPGTDRLVLDGLDLRIPAGRSLAVVGENGAGKTTLVNLLCGFYRPTTGRITVDGVPLDAYDQAGWQRRVAAVFQDYAHYPVSVRENVTFGHPERANDYDVRVRAADQAGLTPVLEALPDGWYTTLSRQFAGGAELSGGQWQRVALARGLFALQCGAGILVLDEPTAHLDVRAEADLYNRFFELTGGTTTIVVSHRFSTVRRAERIAVLDGGRVAEFGTHDQLVALGGRYARMFALQARQYQDAEVRQ